MKCAPAAARPADLFFLSHREPLILSSRRDVLLYLGHELFGAVELLFVAHPLKKIHPDIEPVQVSVEVEDMCLDPHPLLAVLVGGTKGRILAHVDQTGVGILADEEVGQIDTFAREYTIDPRFDVGGSNTQGAA